MLSDLHLSFDLDLILYMICLFSIFFIASFWPSPLYHHCLFHGLLTFILLKILTFTVKIFLSIFSNDNEGTQLPCRAKVNMSDLRIPLMWKDTDHFKNKGGKLSFNHLYLGGIQFYFLLTYPLIRSFQWRSVQWIWPWLLDQWPWPSINHTVMFSTVSCFEWYISKKFTHFIKKTWKQKCASLTLHFKN